MGKMVTFGAFDLRHFCAVAREGNEGGGGGVGGWAPPPPPNNYGEMES